MWQWEQSTGVMRHDDLFVGEGWAGNSEGRNNPALQGEHSVGPLPQGRYTILAPYDHTPANGYSHNLGPYVMNLLPDPDNQMFGRGDFRIHGASLTNPAMSSDGCIVLTHDVRQRIWDSGDHTLEVTA